MALEGGKRRNVWFPNKLWDDLTVIAKDSVVFDDKTARVIKLACQEYAERYWAEKKRKGARKADK